MQQKRTATVALGLMLLLLTASSALAGSSNDPIAPVPGPSSSGKGATNFSIQASGGTQHGSTTSDPCSDALEQWVKAYNGSGVWGVAADYTQGVLSNPLVAYGQAMQSAATAWNSAGCGGGAGYTIGEAANDGGYIDDPDACEDYPCS